MFDAKTAKKGGQTMRKKSFFATFLLKRNFFYALIFVSSFFVISYPK